MRFEVDDADVFWKDDDGTEECDNELAIACLLAENVLFCNECKIGEDCLTTVLYVKCNDVFAWASADAESLPLDEIGNLYRLVKEEPRWGAAKWCAIRRNQKPQPPVIRRMKEDGVWDDVMESLGENTLDAEVRSAIRAVVKDNKS